LLFVIRNIFTLHFHKRIFYILHEKNYKTNRTNVHKVLDITSDFEKDKGFFYKPSFSDGAGRGEGVLFLRAPSV